MDICYKVKVFNSLSVFDFVCIDVQLFFFLFVYKKYSYSKLMISFFCLVKLVVKKKKKSEKNIYERKIDGNVLYFV